MVTVSKSFSSVIKAKFERGGGVCGSKPTAWGRYYEEIVKCGALFLLPNYHPLQSACLGIGLWNKLSDTLCRMRSHMPMPLFDVASVWPLSISTKSVPSTDFVGGTTFTSRLTFRASTLCRDKNVEPLKQNQSPNPLVDWFAIDDSPHLF